MIEAKNERNRDNVIRPKPKPAKRVLLILIGLTAVITVGVFGFSRFMPGSSGSSNPNTTMFTVKRGETVIIDMDNQNRWPHAMHVHGHHFKTLDDKQHLDPVWRDTLLLSGGDRQRVALVADNPGKWLIHCHMIEHQAGGMGTWFEVV